MSMNCGSCMQTGLIDLVTLTFRSPNHSTSSISQPKVIPCTKFEHFGIFILVMLRRNKQSNKQTNRRHWTSYSRRPTESAWVLLSIIAVVQDLRTVLRCEISYLHRNVCVVGLCDPSAISRLWFYSSPHVVPFLGSMMNNAPSCTLKLNDVAFSRSGAAVACSVFSVSFLRKILINLIVGCYVFGSMANSSTTG